MSSLLNGPGVGPNKLPFLSTGSQRPPTAREVDEQNTMYHALHPIGRNPHAGEELGKPGGKPLKYFTKPGEPGTPKIPRKPWIGPRPTYDLKDVKIERPYYGINGPGGCCPRR